MNYPQMIKFFNTNFSKKLNSPDPNMMRDCLAQLQNFKNYSTALLPIFIDERDDKRCLIVSINPANHKVDLFDRERENDSKYCIGSNYYRP